MTRDAPTLTDERLRQALVDLAGTPDSSVLLGEVMRRVDATPQVRRRPWEGPRWQRGALLLAVVAAIVGIGGAVALSGPRPDPQPTPSVEASLPRLVSVPEFVVPFTYRIPDGQENELNPSGSSPYPMYRLSTSSGDLAVFVVTGVVHPCEGADDGGPSTDGGGLSVVALGGNPELFIEQLRDRIGVGLGRVRSTTLGNLSAVEAEIDASRGTCRSALLHADRLGLGGSALEPQLSGPSTLIVGRAGLATIGVLISADDEEAFEEWLPTARRYVESFVFERGAP